jgi:hypothetical protein
VTFATAAILLINGNVVDFEIAEKCNIAGFEIAEKCSILDFEIVKKCAAGGRIC